MSTSGALNPETETRPVLTQSETDRARQYGRVRQIQLGEILYRPGQVGVPCFVLLSASLEIVQPTIQGERFVFDLYPGMFTGEAGMIAGQRTVVQARVKQEGEVLELRPEELRNLVARDAGLSEVLLRAFMLRRLMLITRQLGNVVVIGSQHAADTLRLREFLGRNGHPYTYIDLDSDDTSQELLDRFAIDVVASTACGMQSFSPVFMRSEPSYQPAGCDTMADAALAADRCRLTASPVLRG